MVSYLWDGVLSFGSLLVFYCCWLSVVVLICCLYILGFFLEVGFVLGISLYLLSYVVDVNFFEEVIVGSCWIKILFEVGDFLLWRKIDFG